MQKQVKRRMLICLIIIVILISLLLPFVAYKSHLRNRYSPDCNLLYFMREKYNNIAGYRLGMLEQSFTPTPYNFAPNGFYTWEQMSLLGDVQWVCFIVTPALTCIEYVIKDKDGISYCISCDYSGSGKKEYSWIWHSYEYDRHYVHWSERNVEIEAGRRNGQDITDANAPDNPSLLYRLTSTDEAVASAAFREVKARLVMGKVISIHIDFTLIAGPIAAIAVPIYLHGQKKKRALETMPPDNEPIAPPAE